MDYAPAHPSDQPPPPDRQPSAPPQPPSPSAASPAALSRLAQADLFHAVWQHAADAMVLSDAHGIVVAANPAYFRLYGDGHDAVVGHSFAIIFPPAQRAWAVDQYQHVFATATSVPAYESVIRRADGTERVVELRIEFLSADGQRVALLSTIRDITDRTQAAHEREALLRAAEQAQQAEAAARREAEAAVAVRDQFVTIAAHELRTPLTSVLGYAALLRKRLGQPGGEAELQRMAETVVRHATRLSTQIEQLLDVARLQQGHVALDPQVVDLAAVVAQALELLQLTLTPSEAARITVRNAAGSLPVRGDASRLAEVVHNLLSNAVKYSRAGTSIELRLTSGNGAAQVAVADQGIGIPEAALAQLFRPYYRTANAAAHTSGLGIGLYVANEIVERHGGRLAVASVEGQGSTFTVSLPLVDAPG